MTRSQLIAKVASETKTPAAQIEKIADAIFGSIMDTLANDEKVTIAGFGRFEMRMRKTKAYTNPKTKAVSQLAPSKIPGFKASGILKTKVGK
ncbi:MAG: HU family DNA-binding protein [Ruthenibacterium sp.]